MTRLMAVLGLLVASASPAAAQLSRPLGRVFVSIDGGYQVTSNDFTDTATFRENAENGQLEAEYSVQGGPSLNIAGGATVWRRLAVGLGVTRFSRSTPTGITASVPHPFFFNRAREVTGDVGLKREELAVHLQARISPTVGERFHVTFFGGPSWFQVEQSIVTALTYTDAFPYDTATFSGGNPTTAKESKAAFNAGADVGFFFTRRLGVGFMAQYAGTEVEMPAAYERRQDVKVGGFQAGAGLRLRF